MRPIVITSPTQNSEAPLFLPPIDCKKRENHAAEEQERTEDGNGYDSNHGMSINGARGSSFNIVKGSVENAADAFARDNNLLLGPVVA